MSVFLSKGSWKERKSSGAWCLGCKWGGGEDMIEVLLFRGLTFIWVGRVIQFLVEHLEKKSSYFSRKIINDHTKFFIVNVKFGKKN